MNHLTWLQIEPRGQAPLAVDARKRLQLLVLFFAFVCAIVIARAGQLEWKHGAAYRAEALKPLRREISLPAVRGKLVDRRGAVLAEDDELLALAVHYRYLQQEPDATWLRTQARMRLPKSERRNRERLDAEIVLFRQELKDLNLRLAQQCQIPLATWYQRAARIEHRVEAIAASVNRRKWQRFEERQNASAFETHERAPWWNIVANLPDALQALGTPEAAAWEDVVVKEQVDYHIMVEDLNADIAATVRMLPKEYPGVRVLDVTRRSYPQGAVAANVLGHLGRDWSNEEAADTQATAATIGVQGLERHLEGTLAGVVGSAVEQIDRRGQLQSVSIERPASNGRDVELTIDLRYQQTAEELLDLVLKHNREAKGAALVLVDIRQGDVLTLASAPLFDPNLFALELTDGIRQVLDDPGKPMFDRATRMALPIGSLAQPFTAAALIESRRVPVHAAFHCEGYLKDPEGLGCEIFQQQGVGHGSVTLFDALAKDCRVYFAHYAGAVGPRPLVLSALRYGFGTKSGIEVSESAGTLPTLGTTDQNQSSQQQAATDARLMAMGQGDFTATPLQVARAMAAIANQGRLPNVRLVEAPVNEQGTASIPIEPTENAFKLIREALAQAVTSDESATHGSLSIEGIKVAGLTATGIVGGDRSDHAWCAGYLPADSPRYAFAIAIEHGGKGHRAAAPVARRFLSRLLQLGCFESTLVDTRGL